MPWHYEDFYLHIMRTGEEQLVVNLLSSPAGEDSARTTTPFTAAEVEQIWQNLDPALPSFDRAGRQLIEVGTRLFEVVFHSVIGTQFWRSLDMVPQETGLRVRLRLDPDVEKLGLPWELLYDPRRNRFLASSAKTPIVRHTPIPARITPLRATPPLKILVVTAEPLGTNRLTGEREWRRMNHAFSLLQDAGKVELVRPAAPTFEDLGRVFDGDQYQILHFIGHGDATGEDGESVVHFEQAKTGRDRPISGRDLGALVGEHPSLRLVFLNACEGASAMQAEMTGMATALVRNGVPAVIAMQHRISDDVAAAFADRLYQELAAGQPIDASVALARGAVYRQGARAEWATPVLFMRAADGTVLEVEEQTPRVEKAGASAELTTGHIRSGSSGEVNLGVRHRLGQSFQSGALFPGLLAAFGSVIAVPLIVSPLHGGPLGKTSLEWPGLFYAHPYELIIFGLVTLSVTVAHLRLSPRAGLGMSVGFACTTPLMIFGAASDNLLLTYLGWTAALTFVDLVVWGCLRLGKTLRRRHRRNRRV